jgi:hypothetical protein
MEWSVDQDVMTVNYLGPVALTKVGERGEM